MKKLYSYAATTALIGSLFAAVPLISNAQTNDSERAAPAVRPVEVRERNIDRNRDIRNELRRVATTTRAAVNAVRTEAMEERRDDMEARREALEERREDRRQEGPALLSRVSTSTRAMIAAKLASSTELRGHQEWKQARVDAFAAIQVRFVEQAEKSLDRLHELRDKISARIETAEQNGRDMSEARTALALADDKLLAAEVAVKAVSDYVPSSVSSDGAVASTTNVNLERPRTIGSEAIKAINEARRALSATVVAIARDMGLKTGQDRDGSATTTQQ